MLHEYLQGSGYKVTHLELGDTVIEWLANQSPDLILRDLMLPGKDGLTLCWEVRRNSIVPIIMRTARVEEIVRLVGLRLETDDYICHPFNPREVVARVQATLGRVTMLEDSARKQAEDQGGEGLFRGLEIREENFQALVDGTVLDLTPVEFRMLSLLASAPGRVYPCDRLMEIIYEDGRIVSDRTVDSHVKNLRKKLHDGFRDEEVIRSIYGVGYKFE